MFFEVPRQRGSGTTPWTIGLAIAVALFWGLRGLYWDSVEELPFSDMADIDDIAHRIVRDFDFRFSSFWQTYNTPSLATARAIQIFLAGDSMLAWQIFQSTLGCAGLLWLGYELFNATRSRGLVLALFFLVALSKPSVFWSLKLSREGFAEAATYFTIAVTLFALRRSSVGAFFALGAVVAINFLNRGNAVLLIPIVLAMVAIECKNRNGIRIGPFGAAAAVSAGIAILWAPWITRSVQVYGTPVLLSTQGLRFPRVLLLGFCSRSTS